MSNNNNCFNLKIFKIGSLLGLKEADILPLLRKTHKKEEIKLYNPNNAYNNSVGIYGTISFNDFF